MPHYTILNYKLVNKSLTVQFFNLKPEVYIY